MKAGVEMANLVRSAATSRLGFGFGNGFNSNLIIRSFSIRIPASYNNHQITFFRKSSIDSGHGHLHSKLVTIFERIDQVGVNPLKQPCALASDSGTGS